MFYGGDTAQSGSRIGRRDAERRRASVSIDSAYGERFTTSSRLAGEGSPPYQAVVYFRSNASSKKRSRMRTGSGSTTIPRSGRVLVRPIMAGDLRASLNVPSGRG